MISCGIQSGTELAVGENTPLVYSAKKPQEKFSFSLVEIPSAEVLSWIWSSWGASLAVSAETRAWHVAALSRHYFVVQRPGLRSWTSADVQGCAWETWSSNICAIGKPTHTNGSVAGISVSWWRHWKWWGNVQICKVSNFPNNEIVYGRESCFVTYFSWICLWPFLILADFVI